MGIRTRREWRDRSVVYRFLGFFGHLVFDIQERKIRTSFLLAVSQMWIMGIVTYIIIFILHKPEAVDMEGVWKVILALIPAIFQLAMHIWGIFKGKSAELHELVRTEEVQKALESGKEYLQERALEAKGKSMSGV